MKNRFIAILVLSCLAASGARAAETRCGWVDNPTPGNYTLLDAGGEWVISVQGGYEAKGTDNLPDFAADEKQFVETNGHHGYACGCVKGVFDPKKKQVVSIESAKARLLKDCLGDSHIPYMPRN